MNESGQLMIGDQLEHRHQPRVGYRIGVHRGEKAGTVQMRIANGGFQPFHRIRLERIQHEEAVETIGMRSNRGRNAALISRGARDQTNTADTLRIEFRQPSVSQSCRVGWRYFPTEYSAKRRHVASLFVARQSFIEAAGKEMNMRIVD